MLKPNKQDQEGRLFRRFERYDAIQMTIHILGIFNFYQKNKQYEKIRLINIVWDDNRFSQYRKEKEEAKEYIELVTKYLYSLFYGKFEIEYIPYSEFYERITFSDQKRKEYLKRYILKQK